MAKGFKFKILKFFSFKFCRSEDSSGPPFHPDNPSISTVNFPSTAADGNNKPSKLHRSSFKRHVSNVFGCGLGPRYVSDNDRTESTSPPPPTTPSVMWGSQGEWHVMARDTTETSRGKIYDGRLNGGICPTEKLKRRKKNTKTARRSRISVSSSADAEEERESLIMAASSSPSFSTEKEDEEEYSLTIHASPRVTPKRRRNSISTSSTSSGSSLVRKFVPCTAAAVVKKSKDPYEDFKGSMVEMILEKGMFHEKDLEELLSCFLALNSSQHHGVIVAAFSEIWDVLFSGAGVRRSSFKSQSSYASNS